MMKKRHAALGALLAALGGTVVLVRVDDAGSAAGLLSVAGLLVLSCAFRLAPAPRVAALVAASAALLSWLVSFGPGWYGELAGRAWWPWPSVQPLSTLLFLLSLILAAATSDRDVLSVRLPTVVSAAGAAAFYGFGVDFSLVSGPPWLFYFTLFVAPALLTLLPTERWRRTPVVAYSVLEPLVVVVAGWAALLPALKPRISPASFLLGWLLPTFAVPCVLAAILRTGPALLFEAITKARSASAPE